MQKAPQVMLDLETMGNTPGSVITSIGAAQFGDDTIICTFYRRINPESCIAAGLHMDPSTVMWWLRQGEQARRELSEGDNIPLAESLLRFSRWLPAGADVWGDGAAFDNVLLSCAYQALLMPRPWSYRNDRCYRTVRNLRPEIEREQSPETVHHALHDAVAQARHLMKILKAIGA